MTIKSGSGDDGTTSVSGGQRVPKYHIRIEAYGSVDELTGWIGLLRDFRENERRAEFLIYIQAQLMACISVLGSGSKEGKIMPDADCVSLIEKEIAEMESHLKPLHRFVLSGGNIIVSYCHIARSVCRRAERTVCKLNSIENSPEIVQKILNRLSDYLFVLARKLSSELDSKEITWPL